MVKQYKPMMEILTKNKLYACGSSTVILFHRLYIKHVKFN